MGAVGAGSAEVNGRHLQVEAVDVCHGHMVDVLVAAAVAVGARLVRERLVFGEGRRLELSAFAFCQERFDSLADG